MVLTQKLLYTDVGLVRLTDLPRTKRRPLEQTKPRGVVVVAGPSSIEAERVLRWVERNLTSLTRSMLIVVIEDIPPSMQPHVVGVPKAWV
jgi:hypothetical protein